MAATGSTRRVTAVGVGSQILPISAPGRLASGKMAG